MIRDETNTLQLLRYVFWGTGELSANENVFNDLKDHTLVALPAEVLSSLNIPKELSEEWKNAIVQQVSHYYRYKEQEEALPLTVPYAILKGSSAAQYYPHPEYRAMGDIDIITLEDDYQVACEELVQNGYLELPETHLARRLFIKNEIVVEMHKSFTGWDSPGEIDLLIAENINPTHYLPDLVNGFVLIQHIKDHLIKGIGLRQILDWMLFVNQCLSKGKWPEFRTLISTMKLETLAVYVTRMCEMFLGLPEQEWCRNADTQICRQLMKLILDSGNFGNQVEHDTIVSSVFFAKASNPRDLFVFLRNRGSSHWIEKHGNKPTPFWSVLYQAGRYAVLGTQRKSTLRKLFIEYRKGRQEKKLFDILLEKKQNKKNGSNR